MIKGFVLIIAFLLYSSPAMAETVTVHVSAYVREIVVAQEAPITEGDTVTTEQQLAIINAIRKEDAEASQAQ